MIKTNLVNEKRDNKNNFDDLLVILNNSWYFVYCMLRMFIEHYVHILTSFSIPFSIHDK